MTSAAQSQFRQCIAPFALRAYLAEFISTFLFVFVAVGSTISARMLTPDVTSESSSLVATAIAQGFALFVAVYIAADISGGHCNPAVTFGMAIGGHIAIPSAICYGISQMLGSTFACLVLRVASAGQAIPTTRLAILMTGFGGAVLESVITFMLVYTVFVAADPRLGGDNSKRGPAAALGPLAIGMVEGALVMAVGSLTGGSMNPARSFGPSVVSGDFKNHGVYWAGPLIGAAMAALVHQNVVFSSVASSEAESNQVVEETVLVAETVMV